MIAMAKKLDDWQPIGRNLQPGTYDFKSKNGELILGGVYKDGKFGNRYGLPIPKPVYYREQTIVLMRL